MVFPENSDHCILKRAVFKKYSNLAKNLNCQMVEAAEV